VLSTDPSVIFVKDYVLQTRKSLIGAMLESLRYRPVTLLIGLSWCHQNEYLIKSLTGLIERRKASLKRHRFIVLANTNDEAELLQEAGLETAVCHQNAFLDETLYYPTNQTKRYDAIYDAALAPFKRHELAGKIDSLALISYVKSDVALDDTLRIAQENRHATWLNNPLVNTSSWLSDSEINHFLNQARVGLCLSAIEGAMYASAQYLLAGLPVVTTKNKGGRDVLLDAAYTRWVEDDPDSVAAAVDELARLNIDPHAIRNATLKKISAHRKVLLDLLNKLVGDKTGNQWAAEWPAGLPNRLYSDGIPFHKSLISLYFKSRRAPWAE